MNNFHSLYNEAMEIKAVFSQNLKALRGSTGLSAKDFGAKIGVTGKHVYDMEKGIRGVSIELLEEISRSFGVAKSSLLEQGGPVIFPKAQPEPMSVFAKKILRVPDEIWAKIDEVGPDGKEWDAVMGALKGIALVREQRLQRSQESKKTGGSSTPA